MTTEAILLKQRWVRWVLTVAVLGVLAACGPIYDTQYTLTPPKTSEGRICVQQCQQGRNLCRQGCQVEKQRCLNDARARALLEYQAYVARRTAEKQPVKKSLGDFEQTYACGTSSCESRCDGDHRTCYGDCGGQVTAQRVCTMFCDQEGRPASTPAAGTPADTPRRTDAAATPAAPLCRPGARVEALWEGEWYDAVVTGPAYGDGRCPIHYEGYGSEDDEAVPPRRLRRPRD